MDYRRAYLVGGGIASFAAAAYLIRDGHMPAGNIHIFEELNITGGSMDGFGTPESGYVIRGGREMEAHYECTWDLFGSIPSLTDPLRTVLDEIHLFNEQHFSSSKCRLIQNGEPADFSSLGLNVPQIMLLNQLVFTPDEAIGNKRVQDWFEPTFFETNFWYFWRTMFSFQNWHSVLEMKRYMIRFMHLLPGMNKLEGILRSPYNQYDSMILPLLTWLKSQGVLFEMNTRVQDLDIQITGDEKVVKAIHYIQNEQPGKITVSKEDLVFVTNGSMTESSTLGSMNTPAILDRRKGGSWTLWENIAKKHPDFGNPSVFDEQIDETKWLSFTVTFKDPTFFNYVREFTGNEHGTGGLVTFKDSNWLMSMVLSHQPHFIGQPEDVQVLWGYGLFPDREGNFVKKKMSDCTGAELLTELCHHLKLEKELPLILESAQCIPCMMPYITSQFQPRLQGDRPEVVPKGCSNLAFLGQFVEIPKDCVFTVEYSVRSAQMAVYTLLKLNKEVSPVYEGQYDIRVLSKAGLTLMGDYKQALLQDIGKFVGNLV
ncbi:oleate hydratase [Alicyclobacillaceae bacterium I2511]|nr:oleate hydratase [Alicyclobacillaceae bacterium I2511]